MSRHQSTWFVPVRTPYPEFTPLTHEEQAQIGTRYNMPRHRWLLIARRTVLCIPQTPRCSMWARWALANEGLLPNVGLMMVSVEKYHIQAGISSNPRTAAHQEDSVDTFGNPLALYSWIASLDEEDYQRQCRDSRRVTVSPTVTSDATRATGSPTEAPDTTTPW
jgi:hypothetical protein